MIELVSSAVPFNPYPAPQEKGMQHFASSLSNWYFVNFTRIFGYEIQIRKGKYCKEYKPTTSPFSKKIQCGICGKSYRRKVTATRVVWLCSTFDAYGKKKCASKQIPYDILRSLSAEVLGINEFDVDLFKNHIEKIIVPSANHLTFVFKDGHTEEEVWQHRSRSASWTDEMKEQARQKSLQRRKNNG